MFFLDDEDRAQVAQRRGQHMKLGFALQLVTVRWLGTFLEDPLDVPGTVLEFVAERLEIEDPSQVKQYAERRETPFDHQRDIRRVYGWRDFASVEGGFAARLAVAVKALFESDGWGGPGEQVRVAEVWEAIEAVTSRTELRAALALVNENVSSADAAAPDDWRSELVGRYTTVSGFLKMLPEVIEFGANAEGTPVLEAMKSLPGVLAHRSRLPAPLIPGRLVNADVVNGPWKRLVFGHPVREDGSVNRHAYTFCVLERFWRGLKRREIYADASTQWRNPQADLLEGARWEAIRTDALTALSLPASPDALLSEHSRALDTALRQVGGRLIADPDVRVDEARKIHLTGVKAVEEPPSLVDLRARTTAMLPRVKLPEVILEVMSWVPELAEAFTAVSGGRSRLKDLPVSIAACPTAHSLNVGYRPIAKKGIEALERSRLSHVYQNYFRPETLSPANAPLVDKQAGLLLAQAWGGGLVAAVDGMRFVVPVPAAFARPNRKYFGSKRGMTWLNAMNDRGMGRGAKVVSGTTWPHSTRKPADSSPWPASTPATNCPIGPRPPWPPGSISP